VKEIKQFKSKEPKKWKSSTDMQNLRSGKWKIGEFVEGRARILPKGWGEEIIIENNELYCGKLLKFKAGCKFSMHYHIVKDKTWYVEEGEFIYRWIDTEIAEVKTLKLYPGDVVRQPPGQPHQLEALTIGVVFEVSTHHEELDFYRVFKGSEQERKMKDVSGRKHNMNITVKDPEGLDKDKKRKKK